MNIVRLILFGTLAALIVNTPVVLAAPSPSVGSACASTAYQKVDAMLGEKIVTQHLQALGVSEAQAHARVSQLNEQQLQQLAAQADLIQQGGTMQGSITCGGSSACSGPMCITSCSPGVRVPDPSRICVRCDGPFR